MNCIFSRGIFAISSLRPALFHNLPLKNTTVFPAVIICSKHFSDSLINEVTIERLSRQQVRKRAFDDVDWLPFPWTRRTCHNPFEDSGDLVKELEYDPSWPKPDFELSDELKTASDDIKLMYSLATASKAEIKEVIKRKWLEKVQRHPNDLDSIDVKIALQTLTVRSVFEHRRQYKKERKGGRHVLYILINKRNRVLNTLRKIDTERFNYICEELKLECKPKTLGGIPERYTRKWDLRRLTKEYCVNLVKAKKAAYHKELKQQQEDFLKEKEETLAWIEREEKELANLTTDK